MAVAGDLQRRARLDSDFGTRHALAVSLLLLGEYDEATRTLERLIVDAPQVVAYRSDLAAAYHARARSQGRADDLPRALNAAEEALAFDPRSREAQFNRALALQSLHLDELAREAWEQYERNERTEWRAEAAHRVRLLKRRVALDWSAAVADVERGVASASTLVSASPEAALDLGEVHWPEQWANAVLARDVEEVKRWQRLLESLGRVLQERMHHPIVLQFARFSASVSGRVQEEVAQAQTRYASAVRQLEAYEFQSASEALGAVVQQMSSIGNPLTDAALLSYAGALRSVRRLDQAEAVARLVDKSVDEAPCLAAKRHRVLGLVRVGRGLYSAALNEYAASIESFRRCNLTVSAAQTNLLVAEVMGVLGSREVWTQLEEALSLSRMNVSPRLLQPVYFIAGATALADAQPHAARRFYDAMVNGAETIGVPAAIAEARLGRARALLALNEQDALAAELDQAASLLSQSPDGPHRAFVQGEWLAAKAAVVADSNPLSAATAAEDAIRHAHQTQRSSLLPRAYLARGRAAVRLGQLAFAEQFFAEGIRHFENQWMRVSGEPSRISHFDTGWDLYRDLTTLLAQQPGRSLDALTVLERSQARSLLASLGQIDFEWTPSALQQLLASETGVLYLHPTAAVTFAWVVTGESIRQYDLRVTSSEIEASLSNDSPASREKLKELGNRILGPLETELAPLKRVGIVAPGTLSRIPWAAARLGGADSWTDRAALMIVPSTSVSIAQRRERKAQPFSTRALIVAAPLDTFDAGERLRPLPHAVEEVTAIAANYSGATVLQGAGLTAESILTRLSGHGVFHFAGHAIANEGFPQLSRLVLGNTSETAALFASDLAKAGRVLGRIAVLTACDTASGAVGRAEGPLSIARQFLAIGYQSVLATTRPVTDEGAAIFGTTFHRLLQSGLDVAEATRRTQATLRNSSRNGEWADFVLLGGSEVLLREN